MSEETVTLGIDDRVAVVSLNRPERHNAFTDAMDARFFDVMDECAARATAGEIRCVVWRGEGRSFSSGRDTAELGIRQHGESDLDYIERGHARTRVLYTMPVPVSSRSKGGSSAARSSGRCSAIFASRPTEPRWGYRKPRTG